jgi:hypothetical protein
MSRHQIENKMFMIDNPEAKSYFQNKVVTYSNLTTTQNRLKNKENPTKQDNRVLDWITQEIEKARKEIYNKNENKRGVSIKSPHKTREENNGAKQSDVTGSVYNTIMNESLNTEISEIKYLIEYLTNNNKNNI